MNDEEILTVSQLTQFVKEILEANFPSITLQGEVSNFRRQSSGHLYFSLKDSGAQISAVMFRREADSLAKLPKDGDQAVVRAALNVYPPRGNYQLIVHQLDAVGLGALLLELERLKQEIHRRGWFAKERKRPLPPSPKRIGVVTSPTGAALQDILNILSRRNAGFHLLLNPVRVQGKEAAGEIAQAIRQFNQHRLADVLIVGRGGGSIEELWPFNEEVVARAIFESEIPIVCAVGHETDHCIAEYVADLRAPTPSAAAELVMVERAQQEKGVQQMEARLQQTMRHLLTQTRHRLDRFRRHPTIVNPYTLLAPWMQRIDDLTHAADQAIRQELVQSRLLLASYGRQAAALAPTAQLAHYRKQLSSLEEGIDRAAAHKVAHFQERLKWIVSGLHAIDPKNLLSKGYSILFSEKGRSIINSIHQLVEGESLIALLSDGEVPLRLDFK